MKTKAYTVWKETVIFYLGGMFYCLTELLWRGWTHGSMFLLGGLCFYLVGGLDRHFRISILAQIVLGALIGVVVGGRMFGVGGILAAIPGVAILDFSYHDLFLPWLERRRDLKDMDETNGEAPVIDAADMDENADL